MLYVNLLFIVLIFDAQVQGGDFESKGDKSPPPGETRI